MGGRAKYIHGYKPKHRDAGAQPMSGGVTIPPKHLPPTRLPDIRMVGQEKEKELIEWHRNRVASVPL